MNNIDLYNEWLDDTSDEVPAKVMEKVRPPSKSQLLRQYIRDFANYKLYCFGVWLSKL